MEEVNEESLSVDVIKSTVEGPGHFLGSEQTMKLMKTEYVYPEQADRRSATDWQDAGSEDMWHRAGELARGVLASHRPVYIDSETDSKIRAEYPIVLHFH